MDDRFDVILIGTGLPMLLEGVALAQQGASICFIDRDDQLGGSWKCLKVLGFESVEVGVHLIENRKNLDQLFRGFMEAEALDVRTPDFGQIGGVRLPMPLARILLYAGVAGRHATSMRWEQVAHSVKNACHAALNVGRPLIYPRGGIAAVLDLLETRLVGLGAKILLGREIIGIDVGADGVAARTVVGEVRSDRLVMSSRAHAPIKGFEALFSGQDEAVVTSAVLHLRTERDLPFQGYVEIINDPKLKRVRNVSRFARPLPTSGEALVTVQLRRSFAQACGNEIIRELTRLKLVDGSVDLLGLHRDTVALGTLPSVTLQRLEQAFPDQVTVLRTVDLSDHRFRMVH